MGCSESKNKASKEEEDSIRVIQQSKFNQQENFIQLKHAHKTIHHKKIVQNILNKYIKPAPTILELEGGELQPKPKTKNQYTQFENLFSEKNIYLKVPSSAIKQKNKKNLNTFQNLPILSVFKIKFPSFVSDKVYTVQLINAIQFSTKLKELDIDLPLSQIGVVEIQKMCFSLKNLVQIIKFKINLYHNNLDNSCMTHFGNMFKQLTKLKILDIQFESNEINSEGLKNLFQGLNTLKQLTNLNLDLSRNQINLQAFEILNESFKNFPLLKKCLISLNFNKLGEGDGINIKEFKNTFSIDQLVLKVRNNQLKQSQAEILQKFLKTMPNLSTILLDLHDNKFQSEGVQQILNGISSVSSLKQIYFIFSENELCRDFCYPLIKILEQQQQLKFIELSLSQNHISYDGIRDIISHFRKQQQNLKSIVLNLSGNCILVKDKLFTEFTKEMKEKRVNIKLVLEED